MKKETCYNIYVFKFDLLKYVRDSHARQLNRRCAAHYHDHGSNVQQLRGVECFQIKGDKRNYISLTFWMFSKKKKSCRGKEEGLPTVLNGDCVLGTVYSTVLGTLKRTDHYSKLLAVKFLRLSCTVVCACFNLEHSCSFVVWETNLNNKQAEGSPFRCCKPAVPVGRTSGLWTQVVPPT